MQGKVSRDSPNLTRLLNEHSLVIQEFFQHRVKVWLETVGKEIFDIKYFWARFEFAPARGQIHCHLLAICGSQSFNIALHKLRGDKVAQAKFLAQWGEKAYCLTAETDLEAYENMDIDSGNSPCAERYSEVDNKSLDKVRLCKFCQHHVCSAYCMRTPKGKKRSSKPRYCRNGAGEEQNKNCCDTPGFVLRDSPEIVRDNRGFDKLEMKRNHNRITQSSMDMCQSWRANCDFQILLYDCDPFNPDPAEIARVTDYVVAYACKGNATLAEEKKQLKSLCLK
jgi:hypothetical protein